jgi:hypothetical protein
VKEEIRDIASNDGIGPVVRPFSDLWLEKARSMGVVLSLVAAWHTALFNTGLGC